MYQVAIQVDMEDAAFGGVSDASSTQEAIFHLAKEVIVRGIYYDKLRDQRLAGHGWM